MRNFSFISDNVYWMHALLNKLHHLSIYTWSLILLLIYRTECHITDILQNQIPLLKYFSGFPGCFYVLSCRTCRLSAITAIGIANKVNCKSSRLSPISVLWFSKEE